jgi:hypothetical protein
MTATPGEDAHMLAWRARRALGVTNANANDATARGPRRDRLAVGLVVGVSVTIWQLAVYADRLRSGRCATLTAWMALLVALTGVGLFVSDSARCQLGIGALKLVVFLVLAYVIAPCDAEGADGADGEGR